MMKVIAAAALATIGLAAAADAKGDPQYALTRAYVDSVAVRYGDLDLASPAGAKAMLARIEAAARQACSVSKRGLDVEAVHITRACERDAVADAVARLGAPKVTALQRDRRSRNVNLASVSE